MMTSFAWTYRYDYTARGSANELSWGPRGYHSALQRELVHELRNVEALPASRKRHERVHLQ